MKLKSFDSVGIGEESFLKVLQELSDSNLSQSWELSVDSKPFTMLEHWFGSQKLWNSDYGFAIDSLLCLFEL